MTLAGTRPILQDELRQYELHHRARIAIKPGITGMWQVSGRSDITDFEEVVRLDTEYISKASKPTVENHVRFLETHLVEELKKDTYTSLEALNAAVKKIVADINQRPFQKKSDIRKSRMNGFEKYDKPRMNQLPGESYPRLSLLFGIKYH